MEDLTRQPTRIRRASEQDSEGIVQIYNAGIRSRLATFETRERSAGDIESWFKPDVNTGKVYPVMVAVDGGERIIGFAAASSYRARACYHFIAEYSVYIADDHKRRGLGTKLLEQLFQSCREQGIGKLLSRIFAENEASLALARKCGFREVGVYERHGRREDDGVWHDCVIVEKLL